MAPRDQHFDVAIIGAGILGVTISFWISELYDCSVALIDAEKQVALHTSSRNTGVVHRPFYLDPDKKKIFATAAQRSYSMWSKLASLYKLPWNPVGTLEVGHGDSDIRTLEHYREWALRNGMSEDEVEVIDGKAVHQLEPRVHCDGAIYSKTDTSVDYGAFTDLIFQLAAQNGVQFLGGLGVQRIKETGDGAQIGLRGKDGSQKAIKSSLMINAAGGGAIDIAHSMYLAEQYTDLHFRGEYWVVGLPFANEIGRNIYSVARYKEFPFLDPHFIVRCDGRREIGPNAVLVSGPTAYSGLSSHKSELVKKIFERPNTPKLKLFTNRKFLALVWHECQSSISKNAMCARVRTFIPSLRTEMLQQKGLAGIRSSLIDSHGFVPEALEISSDSTLHILNYNSPGATGAPSFSAHLVSELARKGFLQVTARKSGHKHANLWSFEEAKQV